MAGIRFAAGLTGPVEVVCRRLPETAGDAAQWARQIADAACEARTTALELRPGSVDHDSRVAFAALAKELWRRSAQLELRAQVSYELDAAELRVLRDAGLVGAWLPPVPLDEPESSSTLLDAASATKTLTESGMAVRWTFHGTGRADVIRQISALKHLPPPTLSGASGAALSDAVGHWRENWSANQLTFSRGPEFVRVVDRREGMSRRSGRLISSESVLVLAGVQAEVLLSLSRPTPFARLALQLQDSIDARTLRQLVELLTSRGLITHDDSDRHLALPVHRKLVEVG